MLRKLSKRRASRVKLTPEFLLQNNWKRVPGTKDSFCKGKFVLNGRILCGEHPDKEREYGFKLADLPKMQGMRQLKTAMELMILWEMIFEEEIELFN